MTASTGGSLLPFLGNVALAGIWALYTWARLGRWLEDQAPVALALVARNTAVTLVFLCRRPARTASRDLKEWAVALAGTFMGYFYSEAEPLLPQAGTALMILAALLGTLSTLALGRSFGIVPANRGVKTGGPYSLVRHPLYSSYLVFDVGFLLQAASLWNGLVFALGALTIYLRGRFEERFLSLDPEYRAYAARTRYMLIPGII